MGDQMTTVTLDSNNLEAILADATGQTLEQSAPAEATKVTESTSSEVIKPEVQEPDTHVEDQEDDEHEDENGLTDRMKKEMTERIQKAIGKKHRMMKEAEEFAEAQYREKTAAERRAAELERQLNEIKQQNQPKQPEVAKKPERQDFATDSEYIEATADYMANQRIKEYQAQLERQALINTMTQRVAAARSIVPDFDQVISQNDAPIPPVVGEYMQTSEMIAEISYYFAKNPKALESISKMKPAHQLVEIGKIEAKLEPFGKTPPKDKPIDTPPATRNTTTESKSSNDDTAITQSNPKSRSAPVINPLSSVGGAALDPAPSDMNTRQTIEAWQRQKKTNLNARKRH